MVPIHFAFGTVKTGFDNAVPLLAGRERHLSSGNVACRSSHAESVAEGRPRRGWSQRDAFLRPHACWIPTFLTLRRRQIFLFVTELA